MLQILIWAVAAGLVALGAISFQLGLTAPEGSKANAQMVGVLTLVGAVVVAIVCVYTADEQAKSISSNFPVF